MKRIKILDKKTMCSKIADFSLQLKANSQLSEIKIGERLTQIKTGMSFIEAKEYVRGELAGIVVQKTGIEFPNNEEIVELIERFPGLKPENICRLITDEETAKTLANYVQNGYFNFANLTEL